VVQRTEASASLILGLLSVGLTLGVWAYIFVRAPQGAFHNQGGMLITFILFPLTFLGWAIAGVGAIILGRRTLRAEATSGRRAVAVAGIILGVLGLLLSLGTCIVPENLV
jgi:membrane-bound ClpP family serine protease